MGMIKIAKSTHYIYQTVFFAQTGSIGINIILFLKTFRINRQSPVRDLPIIAAKLLELLP